jgi:hypothetical protein
MNYQTMLTIDTVTTGIIMPGSISTIEVPTLCDDLHTTLPPPGKEEPGYGVPYQLEPVSLANTQLFDTLRDLAENGFLHNKEVGMDLGEYVDTLAQLELWMTAGVSAGVPYTIDNIRVHIEKLLATVLNRQPEKEEIEKTVVPIKIDLTSLRMKMAPANQEECFRLLTKGEVLTAEEVHSSVPTAPPLICGCYRIIIPEETSISYVAPLVCGCYRIIIPEEI